LESQSPWLWSRPAPGRGNHSLANCRQVHYWQDLWRYRELFQVLASRDVSVRYEQTVIGIAWALVRPFLMMVVFTVIFGRLAKLPSDGSAP
jgi:lipopolysaccharide transport system permease protein